MNEPKPPFIRRVALRNYKSIRECDVALGPLVFLVGPNGSGKSNFVDALRFVSESLRAPMGEAFRQRSGFYYVCSQSAAVPKDFAIRLDVNLPDGGDAEFSLVVAADEKGQGRVVEETCRVRPAAGDEASYRVGGGRVESPTMQAPPPVVPDRLYLTNAAGYPQFRPLYDLLSGMRHYDIAADAVRKEAAFGGDVLLPDGAGAGAVLLRIFRESPAARGAIADYLRVILPSLERIELQSMAEQSFETFARFAFGSSAGVAPAAKASYGDEDFFPRFDMRTGNGSVGFLSESMSDGTLHAFGVLLALFQCVDRPPGQPIPLVAIEEPEAALHPGAAAVLFDALDHASYFTQVLATTHSADLLERKDVDVDSLLVVESVDGASVIGPVDEATRSILRDRLYTAGELLRINQLQPANPAPAHVP